MHGRALIGKSQFLGGNAMKRLRLLLGGVLAAAAGLLLYLPAALAQATAEAGVTAGDPSAAKWGYMAAAISTAAGCLGAGVAVAYVGAAAIAGVTEKPETAGRALIFVGLAEGIAIYGLIVAIMILGRV